MFGILFPLIESRGPAVWVLLARQALRDCHWRAASNQVDRIRKHKPKQNESGHPPNGFWYTQLVVRCRFFKTRRLWLHLRLWLWLGLWTVGDRARPAPTVERYACIGAGGRYAYAGWRVTARRAIVPAGQPMGGPGAMG